MQLNEIENMTFAEIKARREELEALAAMVPVRDLAARYVQARADAKHRDEKLAAQGELITQLQQRKES